MRASRRIDRQDDGHHKQTEPDHYGILSVSWMAVALGRTKSRILPGPDNPPLEADLGLPSLRLFDHRPRHG
jgi:hypothetical protein